MLATFVIGLREGLEAALIVGLVAAFLRRNGRLDALRWVWAGVGAAAALCVAVAVALQVVSAELPQRAQEGLETVIGVVAVVAVTWMLLWMRTHARGLKGDLESAAGAALASGSVRALVGMAFLAVLREGLETAVFLLAAFNASGSPATAGTGALLGLAAATALGWGIYRGGVRIDVGRVFRVTGVVLAVVAAGLVVTALHTAHEAGWLLAGQAQALDLSWLVRPGTVLSSLLTGVLGLQPRPTVVEVVGWVAYLVPVLLVITRPPTPQRRPVPRRALGLAAAALAVLALAGAGAARLAAPASPSAQPGPTTLAGTDATVWSSGTLRHDVAAPALPVPPRPEGLRRTGTAERAGVTTDVWTGTVPSAAADGLPRTLTLTDLQAVGGGRLPLGLSVRAGQAVPVTYAAASTVTYWVEPRTGDVVDVAQTVRVTASSGTSALGTVLDRSLSAPAAERDAAAARARHDLATLDRADLLGSSLPLALVLLAAAAAGTAGLLLAPLLRRRSERVPDPVTA
ncbi:high-affinity iron transporter [Motilibacter rhizosphaerae]|uniref:High-affinity iron transporter n=1 Tax=Motilibacter rhizosphaerae TaxID=598652 RepID=A0A4Q7NUX2_9ACTN|nr:iron uptake transporter permease EfeU [Motilibacter rhizosphaerae]RZS90894.1 high-affinity iron transporter [Motilibacter rhizosphaerae]